MSYMYIQTSRLKKNRLLKKKKKTPHQTEMHSHFLLKLFPSIVTHSNYTSAASTHDEDIVNSNEQLCFEELHAACVNDGDSHVETGDG